MKIIDISWPITSYMTAYKDKAVVSFSAVKEFDTDAARESLITLSSHSGTHVDAPSHFVKDGSSIERIELQKLMGPCVVVDCTDRDVIDKQAISHINVQPGDIVLFKTHNSSLAPDAPFHTQFVYVDSVVAAWLVEKQIKAVGIDYLGIERNQPGHDTHLAFFKAGIPIIEGLRLGAVMAGKYTFYCLPLAIVGLEAAPARAILIAE